MVYQTITSADGCKIFDNSILGIDTEAIAARHSNLMFHAIRVCDKYFIIAFCLIGNRIHHHTHTVRIDFVKRYRLHRPVVRQRLIQRGICRIIYSVVFILSVAILCLEIRHIIITILKLKPCPIIPAIPGIKRQSVVRFLRKIDNRPVMRGLYFIRNDIVLCHKQAFISLQRMHGFSYAVCRTCCLCICYLFITR